MCPVHSEDDLVTDQMGHTHCAECSRIRARVAQLKRQNGKQSKDPGRNPREALLRVANAPLRERYQRLLGAGVAASTIATRAGFVCSRKGGRSHGDTTRLERALGLVPEMTKHNGKRYSKLSTTVAYATAVALCPALEIEYPAEVGV